MGSDDHEWNGVTRGDAAFAKRVLIAALIAGVLYATWLLADVLLLVFASVLLAIVLHAIADPIADRTGMGPRLALAVAIAAIAGLLAGAIYLFGSQLGEQLLALKERLPRAIARLQEVLKIDDLGNLVGQAQASTVGSWVTRALSWGLSFAGGVAFLVVCVFAAIYLAIDPGLYRRGALLLLPRRLQSEVDAMFDDCSRALRQWLGAQALAMLAVGVLTAGGLALVGVPSPLALGLIAGIAEFVPYAGPVLSALPGLLIAASQDWQTFWSALAVYVVVQQVENNLLVPLLASRNVAIPSAVAIFSIIAMGVLLGPLGLLLAFPLTVVLFVAVKRFYVLDTLGRPVEIAGKPAEP